MSRIGLEKQSNVALRCTTAEQFRVLAGVQEPPPGFKAVSEGEAKELAAKELAKKKQQGGGDGGGGGSPSAAPASGDVGGSPFLGRRGPLCSCAGVITGKALAAAGLTGFFCIEPAKM